MSKIITLMFFLSFGFSSNHNITSYNVTFEEELKLLRINTEIQNKGADNSKK